MTTPISAINFTKFFTKLPNDPPFFLQPKCILNLIALSHFLP